MKSSGSFASLQHSIPSGSPTSSGTLSRSPLSSSATFGIFGGMQYSSFGLYLNVL